MPRVLHTAQALVDIVVDVPGLPPHGGNVNATAVNRYAGGASTILLAAARTGATAVHGGAHGTGPHGDLIRSVLAADGVALSDAPIPDQDTGSCFVFVEPTAERTFVTTYGAERRISVKSLSTLAPAPDDFVCISGYSLFPPTRDPLLGFLRILPRDAQIVLDPGDAFAEFPRELQREVLTRATLWTSNADEARALTGIEDLLGTLPAIARFLPPGAIVVVRDGARGCYLLHHGHTLHIPGFPQIPVDTNGAGDTHTGTLVAERALGADWPEAARRANAAAALAVTRRGPTNVPHRAEVDDFLRHYSPSDLPVPPPTTSRSIPL
ncbi:PfkB family carbohydrate kinase [Devriesea agamarum]|uniref:PfkB family carbohydrate kinase n=1 Tax=Devriesea agamarum TaxID=472569 RepID=UPI0009FB95DB|nr:PfkB family carbohydrate kinase [Devriesea agamarum]